MSNSTQGFPDRGPVVFAVATATLCLATVFVAARLVARVGIVRRSRACDHMMWLAWLIAVFLSVSVILAAKLGLGRHERDIDPDKRNDLRTCEYVFSVLYNPALMATKTSILLFYFRLSEQTQRALRLASWATMGVVNVAGTVLTLINIFQCQPIAAAWDITVEAESCVPLLTEFICSAPINVVTDIAILALPIPVLTRMRLPPRQKTILVATFALGIFVTVVDVIRIYYLQQAIDRVPMGPPADATSSRYAQSDDFSWNASFALMWSAVEVNVGIICACIPTLKPLVIRVLPVMLVDGRGTQETNTGVGGGTGGTKQSTTPAPLLPLSPPTLTETTSPGPDNPTNSDDEIISIHGFLSNTAPPPRPSHHHRHQHPSTSTTTTTASSTPQTPRQQQKSLHFITLPATPKSLLTLSARESLLYSALVSCTLFFLWGFTHGLLNSLNNAAAAINAMSEAQRLGLTAVYFGGGYLAGPAAVLLVRWWLVRRGGGGDDANEIQGHGRLDSSERRRSWWWWTSCWGCGRKARELGCWMGERRRRRRRRRCLEGSAVGWFKGTFITGLLIYGTGTIMFWPGAAVGAYGGFVASNFVVGFGLAVLETAANPFLVLCGPPAYADARLLLAQAVQAVGSVLSGVLADRVLFERLLLHEDGDGDSTTPTLINVQWTYLAITLLAALLALFFYYIPLPEASDADLAEAAARLPIDPSQRSVGGVRLRTWALGLAVFAQWCYVSAQETLSLFSPRLLTSSAFEDDPMADPSSSFPTTTFTTTTPDNHLPGLALSFSDILLLSHGLFALSRFIAGFLSLLSANLALRGQGSHTKSAAACITLGGSGPGVWPFVAYAIIHRHHHHQGMMAVVFVTVLVLVLTAAVGVFPTFVGLSRGGRGSSDQEARSPQPAPWENEALDMSMLRDLKA
ncbi:hypothetical protein N658DRAFT_556437 [Parathielavia hyrcaniae]|uniref:Rhodopsin domain-containing protein n=1 Tax=Parathielavia hyrcaniae TaxID=113614 RepID=A0AAN6Q7X2_9PEZI|nr:hypothetical protein N658DRAFT_556437 [Parathielavia hyrcaniae]